MCTPTLPVVPRDLASLLLSILMMPVMPSLSSTDMSGRVGPWRFVKIVSLVPTLATVVVPLVVALVAVVADSVAVVALVVAVALAAAVALVEVPVALVEVPVALVQVTVEVTVAVALDLGVVMTRFLLLQALPTPSLTMPPLAAIRALLSMCAT
jgi:hypothetical protein